MPGNETFRQLGSPSPSPGRGPLTATGPAWASSSARNSAAEARQPLGPLGHRLARGFEGGGESCGEGDGFGAGPQGLLLVPAEHLRAQQSTPGAIK